MHAATYPVHPEPFTVEDLQALPDDGMRHELIDGALLVTPPPSGRHQLVVTELTVRLAPAATAADLRVLEGPGVRLSNSRVLQPDLVVGHRAELAADVLYFSPTSVTAVVEVVSPSSAATDRITKPALCAEAGIPAFIRVELTGPNAPEVYVYRLDGETYREYRRAQAGQRLHLDDPFSVTFDPAELTAS